MWVAAWYSYIQGKKNHSKEIKARNHERERTLLWFLSLNFFPYWFLLFSIKKFFFYSRRRMLLSVRQFTSPVSSLWIPLLDFNPSTDVPKLSVHPFEPIKCQPCFPPPHTHWLQCVESLNYHSILEACDFLCYLASSKHWLSTRTISLASIARKAFWVFMWKIRANIKRGP